MSTIMRFVLMAIFGTVTTASEARDLWAKNSEALRETDETIDWVAPKGVVKIHSDVDKGQLIAGGKFLDIQDVMNPGLTEVNWSNDAHALFINSSDGGDVGTWSTRAFVITEKGVQEIRVINAISKQRFPSPTPRDYLNVMSIGWIDNGASLLVLRHVPNSSDYKDMNLAIFYVVDIRSGHVTAQLTPTDAAKKYHELFGPGTEAITRQSPNDKPSDNAVSDAILRKRRVPQGRSHFYPSSP